MTKGLSLHERPDLVTERLSLRRPNDGDMNAIVSIVGDWDVARRLARVPHPYGPDDAQFFLDQIVPAEWVWAITLRGSGVLIGAVGLTPENDAETAELSYWLSRAHWGKGVATEAARAVVTFGLVDVGCHSLTSGNFEDNPASGQVLRKLGFVETGHVLRPCLAVGGKVPPVRLKLPCHPG
ncbi:GNAT family N-acetyltransferase [Sphingomonas sp. PL-96]|uniref:GNAT family N-acetyltransferase n=1 Tax=Sphingomonas sp. PL-96 TaxID=2887201 RepID=UPI001E3B63B1|nr:GNAT family N-acetyltransferase [Sphingomonas sp. PL-96]MCC2976559.1 GNAT family N-acetyltransferase [Sphingomonas sp. PL-96]